MKGIAYNLFFFLIISVLLLAIGVSSLGLLRGAARLEQLENTSHKLYVLGVELQDSSEDLTRYCRTYILTGDTIWQQKYWEVLAIRNGVRPRPDGRTIALRDSLLKLGIVDDEYEKLSLAEENSNRLVWTEKVAFNAMSGLFADENKEFTRHARPDTIFAREILFGKEYHADKEEISRPIAEFRSMLEERTSKAIAKQRRNNIKLLILNAALIILILILSFYSVIVLRRKTIQQINELHESNDIIKANETRLIHQHEEIKTLHDELQQKNSILLELNETKDKFFSIIGHDLRNPISSIIQFIDLLIEKSDKYSPEKIKKLAQLMSDSANLTRELLENLLTWANIQTGSIEAKAMKILPSELAGDTKRLCEPLAGNKGITLETNIHADDYVFADEEMVKTVLRNITTNAIKYSYPDGTVEIETQKQADSIIFTVSDTGTGIGPEHIGKIFNTGGKLSQTGTNGEKGTGLGLILCKEFVEKNHGRIWVESEMGKGSKFHFSIPIYVD